MDMRRGGLWPPAFYLQKLWITVHINAIMTWGDIMRITTIRHGRTYWNSLGRIQGHADIELDEAGLYQAEKVAAKLADNPVDIIYTSDLKRAKKTAEIIAAYHNVPLEISKVLREISFGIFEGRLHSESHAEMDIFRKQGQPFPGSEDVAEYFARVHAFLDEILERNHKNIFIVGHYGTVRAAICYFLESAPEWKSNLSIGNTAVHIFEKDASGSFKMIVENDMSHIENGMFHLD